MIKSQEKEKFEDHVKFTLKNQGPFVIGLIVIFYGYFGIICNSLMVDQFGIMMYTDLVIRDILMWTWKYYIQCYMLPVLLLFLVCFIITYGEDIPEYGIKNSIWYVPFIILASFIWHWVIYGDFSEPFILLFANWRGYLYIFLLIAINLSGALCGMKTKQYIIHKRVEQLRNT